MIKSLSNVSIGIQQTYCKIVARHSQNVKLLETVQVAGCNIVQQLRDREIFQKSFNPLTYILLCKYKTSKYYIKFSYTAAKK